MALNLPYSNEEFLALLEKAGQTSNRNLLDNWYFADPINQRGQTAYTAAGYTIDRWRLVHLEDGYGLTVNDEFVTLSAGSTKETRLDQFFENSSAYYGETATVSVMLSDGKIYTGTGTIPIPDGKGYVTTFFISRSDVDCLVQAQPTGQLIFRIIAKLGHSVDIAAVKLELGEHSTLKNDAPPSKAEELAKCQRYQWVNQRNSIRVRAAAVNSKTMFFDLATPASLRSVPNAFSGVQPTIYDLGLSTAQSEFSVVLLTGDAKSGHVVVEANKTDHGLTDGVLVIPAGTIIDANL